MVRDFTAAHLREYATELQEAELSPATVHQYHRTLKPFLGFCAREGMLVDERVHDVMAPRVPQTEPEAYTLDVTDSAWCSRFRPQRQEAPRRRAGGPSPAMTTSWIAVRHAPTVRMAQPRVRASMNK